MIALLQTLAFVLSLGGGVHAMGGSNAAPHRMGPWFSTVSHGAHTDSQQPRSSVGSKSCCS